jgi:hypothetical protein
MRDRIAKELDLLKKYYPDTDAKEVGDSTWFKIPSFLIPGEIWNKTSAAVCFEAKITYPGTPPYSFYIEGGLRSKDNADTRPKDYEEPAATPFNGTWGRFSWQHDSTWNPTEDLVAGSNLLNFVRSFGDRLKEGL